MDCNKVCYFLLTGASKGIGRTVAIECAKLFKNSSRIVLTARSLEGLEKTRSEILAINPKLGVQIFAQDLSKITTFEAKKLLNDSLGNSPIDQFELAFIVHNAASLGDVTKRASELNDINTWKEYYQLNIFSPAILNSEFMQKFSEVGHKLIVNITSKAAIHPFPSMALYCSGKAARELYFRVLATEEEKDDNATKRTLVLNYSPGPVDTEMAANIRQNSRDDGMKTYFQELYNEKKILTTLETTKKFLQVITAGKFKSGDHVDYYDDE